MEQVGKYLCAAEVDNGKRKTRRWVIKGRSGHTLGTVRWHAQWRQYCFFPITNITTLFNTGCLTDMANFLEQKTTEHKEALHEQHRS